MTRGEPASLTGRTLGDFTVLEKLGEGGYGVVHRAEQRGLGREAVVKILRARHGASERVVQRFLREAQLASKLDHPYAAHIYAFGAEPDGLLWIAMELVRGTPLSRVLAAQPGGRMPVARWAALLDRISEVVHTAHEQGIVHRDLKPDNIMVLSRAGRLLPKLLDLGVAKLTIDPTGDGGGAEPSAGGDVRLTQDGARVGSPFYMAPEQWSGGEIDARTDLYALGVVTYEALTGKVPFAGATAADIARGHLRGEPPPLPDDVPAGVAAVVKAALAKDREARPASVLAFAEAVRAAAGLRLAADALPRLDEGLRADVAWMPQPIADAVAALEAARNPHQARDALWAIVRVAARWIGIVALAARSRVGPGPGGGLDPPLVVEALRQLHRRDLSDDEWLELVRALARPFAGARDAYPMPELVDLALAEPSPFAPLVALRVAETADTSEESLREWLARTLPIVTPLLRALGFLTDYQLVVPRDDGAEVWMGQRRAPRPMIHIAGGVRAGEAALVDLDGRPVLALAPLVTVAAPAPGGADELFLFAGPGRARGRGARLVAEPHAFERHDDAVWDWFRDHLLSVDEGGAAAVEETPYRGLAAFTEKDAERFFGRERQAEAFVNQLLVTPLLAVVGPSGAGKSSFVQAGVLPLLPAGWRSVAFRPGAAPMAAFATRVDLASGSEIANETLVIVIDQFEELFTLCGDAGEREQLAAALAAAARSAAPRVRVVLTLRDDFLVRAGELGPLRDRLAQGLTLLGTPAPDDLLRIVTEPARRAGYDFDDKDLPGRMVRAVAGQPGALALLSFTAAQLWELRDRHFKRLTRRSYDAIGGVEGALAAHADATLAACSADEQRLVRDAFRHLVTAEGTRAVLTRHDLDAILGTSVHAAAVIERLVKARLLVASEGETGDDRIEIIHEALITAWPRLVEWRRDDAEGARLRDQLRAAARQWADRDRARGLLWRDDALDDYRRWRARWPGALPALDEEFAAASLKDAARGRRIRRALAATAATVLVGATVALSLLYRSSRHNAAESHDRLVASYVEQGRRLLLDGDYLRALPYLSAAYSAGDDSFALRFMLHRAIKLADTPTFPVYAVAAAFHGPGELLIADEHGELTIRDVATHRIHTRLPVPADERAVKHNAAISADGSRAAVMLRDAVIVWDGTTARPIPVPNAVRVALSADGTRLAVSDGHVLSAWDARDGSRRWAIPRPAVLIKLAWVGDAVVSIDAERNASLVRAGAVTELGHAFRIGAGAPSVFATVASTGVEVWDVNGTRLHSIETTNAANAAVSADGAMLAVVTATGAVELVDVATGHRSGALAGHRGGALPAFNLDGTRLITVGEDRTVRIWDVRERSQLAELVGADSAPVMIAFDASGRRAVIAGAGGVRVLGLSDPGALVTIDTRDPVDTSGFAPGDARIFTTGGAGLDLWDAASGAHLAHYDTGPAGGTHLDPTGTLAVIPLAEGTDAEMLDLATSKPGVRFHASSPLNHASFDPSGRRIVTAASDGAVDVWDARGPHLLSLLGHTGDVLGADVSPDGRHVVAAGYADHTIIEWDLESGRAVARARTADSLSTAVFNGRGDRILTASDDRSATLWDARTLTRIASFEHDTIVRAAAIDHDAHLIAGATRNGTVSIWDVASRQEVTRFHHGSVVMSADFARAGDRLVTGGGDRLEMVWDVGAEVPSAAAVAAFTRCHVPYVLRGTSIEPIELAECPAPPPL
jgi:WD40 repeat protein